MEIPDIGTTNIQIRQLNIPSVDTHFNNVNVPIPPVTSGIGFPVVEIPGCVEARDTEDLRQNDARGNMILCDGGVPSFNPIEFSPNDMRFGGPANVPAYKEPEKRDPVKDLDTPLPAPPATAIVSKPAEEGTPESIGCPTPAQAAKEPVGTYLEGFRKKVTGYELIGNQCVQYTDSVPIPEQIVAGLPSPGSVVMTGGIAVIATASALMAKPLADILLKVIKPTVKKVMKKIAKLRGKADVVLSVSERREEQRDRNRAIMELRRTFKGKS